MNRKNLSLFLLFLLWLSISSCKNKAPQIPQSETGTEVSATEEKQTPATESKQEPTTSSIVDTVAPADSTPTKTEAQQTKKNTKFVDISDIIPDIQLDIRYASSYNFVGTPVDGYKEPLALCTREAAQALKKAADDLRAQGYLIKIYDAYRPQMAVNHFVRWAKDLKDTKMKADFYPEKDKSVLFDEGYIAYKSGHTRGSTFDLTIVDAKTKKDVDMGGTFDYFGMKSHPSYRKGITEAQYANRMLLRKAMVKAGFNPLSTEWWHFTLKNEPYPTKAFNFVVSKATIE